MLSLEALAEADKYVKLFYEELQQTPSTMNGFKEYITGWWRDDEVEKHEKEKAKQLGLDALGLDRVKNRIPIIMYVTLNEEERLAPMSVIKIFEDLDLWKETYPESFSSFDSKEYQIGLSHEILQTYYWLHDQYKGFPVSRGDYKEPDNNSNTDLTIKIGDKLNERIQCLCSGVMYHGLTAEGENRLLAFVDTSGSTRTINSYNIVAKKCVEMADRFGIDGFFTLSAEHSLIYSAYEEECKLHPQARFDVDDGRYVDLSVENVLDKVRLEMQYEGFWRMLIGNYLSQGKLTLSDPYPEGSMRDLLRDHLWSTLRV